MKSKYLTEKKPGDSASSIVSEGGFTFLWALNHECERDSLLAQLREFKKAGIKALVFHPRSGLLFPYGGSDWFQMIRWLVRECHRHGIEPILYDEDPYPSGNAGGRITVEHPEFTGCAIARFEAPADLKENELFIFPAERLCWAGIVFPGNGKPLRAIDLTARVGMIRRHWEKAEWDSRFYYPVTPIYPHPRAMAHHAEYALRMPKVPKGAKVVAFVIRPVTGSKWENYVDTLNPEATRCFLEYTHERYQKNLGEEFYKHVRSIFTDEAKPQSEFPWTPGLFESFRLKYGYDLRPCLEAVFSRRECPFEMKVRLDYRDWISQRFEESWMKPVSQWCRTRNLALIGHLSPEEDPVSQSSSIGNLFPLQKHLSWAGFDIIIRAAGDRQHPLLNVAATAALSAAQQNRQPGVCCESLGAVGFDVPPFQIAQLLAWQILNGVNLAVLHCAFLSQMGLRRLEAPPDYGPQSPFWEDIKKIHSELNPFLRITLRSTQEAPVAIFWPIRSFQINGDSKQGDAMRDDLLRLLSCCLENQIGVHFLDEEDFLQAKLENGKLTLGRAGYSWILVPSSKVYLEETLAKLKKARHKGIQVIGVGSPTVWRVRKKARRLLHFPDVSWPQYTLSDFCKRASKMLPRLLVLPDQRQFRASVWRRGKQRELLLMHFGEHPQVLALSENSVKILPGDLVHFVEKDGKWKISNRFSASNFPPHPAREEVTFGSWKMDLPDGESIEAAYPLGAWQLIPHGGKRQLPMTLTNPMCIGGGHIADSITYRVKASFPKTSQNARLCIEPTLMRGRFTLKVGGKVWHFKVSDTDTKVKKIDLSSLRNNGSLDMTFILHEPEAPDGIKHHPHIEM